MAENYSIPTHYLEGFTVISELAEEPVQGLISALNSIPIGANQKGFVDAFSRVLPNQDDAERAASAVFSMGRLLSLEDANVDKISEGLAKAYFRQNKQIDLHQVKGAELSSIILRLLNAWVNAKKTFKAARLQSHNERIYRDASIVTDIRLIFEEDLGDKNRSAIVMHQLEVNFMSSVNDHDEVFLSLNSQDLTKLKEQINRALEKEQKIKDDYSQIISFVSLED